MEEIKKIIQETYRDTIAKGDYPPDLKKFLRVHERKLVFFERLVKEFNAPALKNRLTRETLVSMTRDLTHTFVSLAKRRADELNMSAIERGMIRHKQARKEEMVALADALENEGVEHVTQDQAGNEISRHQATIGEKIF